MKVKISGVIISFNEEDKIERCIRSMKKVCDEIILLDSFSTDKTCSLAESLGAKVHQHAFDGHIEQKNRAIKLASSPYVLSLDSDEELSEELIDSIALVKENWQFDMYSMNRLNNYGGQWIRHGAWYPDKKFRLWDARIGQWGGENPHDKFLPHTNCTKGFLKGNLLHYTMNGLEDLKRQTDKFASIAAKAMHLKNKKISIWAIYFKSGFRFFKEYLLLLGFMDGKAGLDIAKMDALYVYLKYTRLKALYKS